MPRGESPFALTGSSVGGSLFSLTWVLLCVVVIILLAYLFTRYVARRGGLGFMGASGGTGQLKVLARLSLGREQSVALVQAGERYLLLGVTASKVELLAELTREEAEAMCSRPADQPQPPSFRESLRTVLKQRKKR